jgi:tripeptide aminopeptidase
LPQWRAPFVFKEEWGCRLGVLMLEGRAMAHIDIDRERLARTFMDLVRIDSISREEAAVCRKLQADLTELGATTRIDAAGRAVGGDTGNLIARIDGDPAIETLLLSAHMDTVEPGRGIEPVLSEGVFTSGGPTVLGADDKAGVAIILEVLRVLRDSTIPHGPLELVFSICEEVGLLGAKHLEFDQLTARMGYVLDTRDIATIITRAPAANRLTIRIDGKAAHAGAHPERGINAIALAGKALGIVTLGRIDAETTCNIGTIYGGVATNIVPDTVVMEGEVRSHDMAKLEAVTAAITAQFQRVVDDYPSQDGQLRPSLDVEVTLDFDRLRIDRNHTVVTLACRAAENLGRAMVPSESGGGSDASVFFQHGIVTGVLGTGCDRVHTVEERIALDDMADAAAHLLEVIRLHAQSKGTD